MDKILKDKINISLHPHNLYPPIQIIIPRYEKKENKIESKECFLLRKK